MDQTDGLPKVQGIQLIGTHQLPDRIRHIFPFPAFNAIQSKCFSTVYRTDDNFVLSSPTGSGKTAIFELAICRLAASQPSNKSFKVVYQAPTKSLCSERSKDWQSKFSHLNLTCAELTGDTEHGQLRTVQQADILITTPEKWDSITRKWRDHRKLMELVRLFLIDEVHMLKEDRGANLEAVVSRMKSVGSEVRFIALSATVPNSEDIATWLGRSNRVPGMPAAREVFGEDFRPAKLQRFVVGLQSTNQNDFAFDKTCDSKLPEIISQHSVGKPIMVFCMTRAIAEQTAQLLVDWWSKSSPQNRYWEAPRSAASFGFGNATLHACATTGVAFHHAGLALNDRAIVESCYFKGDINVICCTSTLAAGVNLPCHFVIIKNTMTWQDAGPKEYSDLDIMQMLGRAGRPQFDKTAVAVVITRAEKADRYERMVSGQEVLESKLHLNLIEHLNAEVVLGTIKDLKTATTWLQDTFLFTRFRKNPDHYQLRGSKDSSSPEQIIQSICEKDIELLRDYLLITDGAKFKPTEFGDAMARYYVQFQSMKVLMSLQGKARISEIISAVAQASELQSLRFRLSEKQLFKDINSSPSVRYPIPVDLALAPHKVSLIIQATLGGLDARHEEHFGKHKQQFLTDTSVIFQHVPRLVRCLVDCAVHREDSVTARNGLELARSLGARIWDDSPLQLMQIEKIGPVAARKLASAHVSTIEELEDAATQKIDMILSKNPPFASNLLRSLDKFPKLRVSLQKIGQPKTKSTSKGQNISVEIEAELGFLNDPPLTHWKKNSINVTMLVEISDGRVAHFCRMSAQKIGLGENMLLTAPLTAPRQVVTCYVACDDIAGTLRTATLDPKIPASAFDGLKVTDDQAWQHSRPNSESSPPSWERDDFGDIDDSDLIAVDEGFDDIDELSAAPQRTQVNSGKKRKAIHEAEPERVDPLEPKQLPNGKWPCDHTCSNKNTCKHLCCREGKDDKTRPSVKKRRDAKAKMKQTKTEPPIDDFFTQSQNATSMKKIGTYKGVQPSVEREDRNLAPLLPSSHDLFMTSSPEKRCIEMVNLSDEPSPQVNRYKSNRQRALGPENDDEGHSDIASDFEDDFGMNLDDGLDEDTINEQKPRLANSHRKPTEPSQVHEQTKPPVVSQEQSSDFPDLGSSSLPSLTDITRSRTRESNSDHRQESAEKPDNEAVRVEPLGSREPNQPERSVAPPVNQKSQRTRTEDKGEERIVEKPAAAADPEGVEEWFKSMFGDCAEIV